MAKTTFLVKVCVCFALIFTVTHNQPQHSKRSEALSRAFLPISSVNLAKPQRSPEKGNAGVSPSVLATIEKGIATQEYSIRYQPQADCLQSPNRKQNLRFSYTENGFSAQLRHDSTGHENWEYGLSLQGLYKGKNKIAASSPARVLQENKLTYDYGDYTAEYINNETGMRQNFMVKAKPEGDGLLKVALNIEGTLAANLEAPTELVLGTSAAKGTINAKARYKDLKVWDAEQKILPAHMELEGRQLALVVDDKDAVYPITIDPLSTTADITLESNQASAYFGCSVASAGDVNGDGYSDVIVGAYAYDNGQTDEGVAFIYMGSASGLSTTAAATLEKNQASSQMGWAVSTAGDVNGDGYSDVIVGAYQFDHGQTDEGEAMIYLGSSSGLSTTAATTLESNQSGASLGWSVATAGDVNGDGYSDVIVGAYLYDNGQTDEGAAFVYLGSSTGISATASTTLESNQASAQMGYKVASAGDVDGDGYSDIIVGADLYDNGETDEGVAFVYLGSSSGVSATAANTLEQDQASAKMGHAVAPAGDVNGDGYSDVIVGASKYDDSQTDEGAAFIYLGSSSGLSSTAATTLEKGQASAEMGSVVAPAGDINGDGYSDVIVDAWLYDDGQTDEGAAFVYFGSSSGIPSTPAATIECNQANAFLGVVGGIASAGDINGDGYSDVIVGSRFYDKGQTDEGAAFVYLGSPSGLSTSAQATLESSQSDAYLGYSLASAGDVNGDGYSDIVAGAYQYDNGSSDEGAAFIYLGSSSGISASAQIQLECNQGSAYFGKSVASAGDVNGDGYSDVIVGADYYDDGQVDEGAAFVYHGSSSGITSTVQAQLECNLSYSYMGQAVASAGDVNGDGYSDVIVGAWAYDDGNSNEGAAFVYPGSSSGVSTTEQIKLESDQTDAYFGKSVAGAGDVNGDGYSDIIVGADYYDNGQVDEGAAFVYHGSSSGITSTVQAQFESNVSYSYMGHSVASAGDVNGDGYSDIIIGAWAYDDSYSNEGAAFVHLGSSSGVSATAQIQLEGNQTDAYLGKSVASAGDVNGDGYSDIIVGADYYDDGQSDEGAAFVYHGSSSGITSTVQAKLECNVSYSYMGQAVASAGDVNGDGYSDVIAGAWAYDDGNSNEGAVFVYLGNNGGGLQNNLRLYDLGTSSPLSKDNFTESKFTGSLYAKSFLGRQAGKMLWETEPEGTAFSSGSNGELTNSVSSTSAQSSYSDLGLTGTELTSDISKVSDLYTRVRARVKYNPVTAITGQVYGPWIYPVDIVGLNIAPLPVSLIGFTASWKESCSLASLSWTTASETNSSHFDIERSWDGEHWVKAGTVAAAGNSQVKHSYHFEDYLPAMPSATVYYRLKQVDFNGKNEYLPIRSLYCPQWDNAVLRVYPVPAGDALHIVLKQPLEHAAIRLFSATGAAVLQQPLTGSSPIVDVRALKPGTYYLHITVEGLSYYTQTITVTR